MQWFRIILIFSIFSILYRLYITAGSFSSIILVGLDSAL